MSPDGWAPLSGRAIPGTARSPGTPVDHCLRLPDPTDDASRLDPTTGRDQIRIEPSPGRGVHDALGDRDELALDRHESSLDAASDPRIRDMASATRATCSSVIPTHSGSVTTLAAASSVTGKVVPPLRYGRMRCTGGE